MMDLSAMRKDYKMKTLTEADIHDDALIQFRLWLEEALSAAAQEPNAMTLSTCGLDAKPSARVVLLKEITTKGFIFYTNYDSHKGMDLAQNPYACLTFYWSELERQVRIEGKTEKISREESEKYFYSRPFQSQVSAYISPQSKVIEGKDKIQKLHDEMSAKYKSEKLPYPENWGGYIVIPNLIEFWQGRENRFHDRIQYTRDIDGWRKARLAP